MKMQARLTAILMAGVITTAMGAATAHAGLDFSSTFDGSAPWNWDNTVTASNDAVTPNALPFVTGTNQLQAGFTNVASNGDAAYAIKAISGGTTSDNFIQTSFDVSFHITGQDQVNDATLFQIGVNNGNQHRLVQIMANINKSAGIVRFQANASGQYGSSSSVRSANFALSDSFTLTQTTIADSTGVHTSLFISDNTALTQDTVTAAFGGTNSNLQTSLKYVDSYQLGVTNAGSNLQDFAGTITFDNFNATTTPIPEPASLGLLGLGALASLRRRR